MPFIHHHTVRFHEADPGGVVFFANFFRFAHDAFEALLTPHLGSAAEIFERGDFGTPLVHVEADYRRPVRAGERIQVEVTLEATSAKTVTFRHRILGPEGDPRASLKLVHAFIDRGFKGCPRPQAFDDALAAAGLGLEEPPSEA